MQILYHDAHVIVVDKPAGLLSVPGRLPENKDCVTTRLQGIHADALNVHRLDQVTSGLMVFARSKAMQAALSTQFRERKVAKRYTALVEGLLVRDSGEVHLPLMCDWPNRPRQMVSVELGKPALTQWRVLARDEATQTTRVELTPITGRSHQLRVHMKALGHTIVGDDFYGAKPARRVMLHAAYLGFDHPAHGVWLEWCSETDF